MKVRTRFTLRILFLFVALFGLILVPLGIRVKQASDVGAIRRAGGMVGFSDDSGPQWARKIVGDRFFGDVDHVSFPYGTNPTDEDLERVAQFRGIELLWLENSGVTDAGLKHLVRLRNLETLNLAKTKVSDAGLAHLRQLTKLKDLGLWDTQISDAGLRHLSELRGLEQLRLQRTNVTDEGVDRLKEALPNCTIYR